MNLAVWLPTMFALGVMAMGLCYLFLDAGAPALSAIDERTRVIVNKD